MGLDINVFGQIYSNIEGITVSAVNDGPNDNSTYTYIVPSGTITVTATPSAPIDVTQYAEANITITPSLQTKEQTITPGATEQTIAIIPDDNFDGLSQVNVTVQAENNAWTHITTQNVTINNNSSAHENLLVIDCLTELNINSQIICARVRYNGNIDAQDAHYFGADNFYIKNTNITYNYRQAIGSTIYVSADKSNNITGSGRDAIGYGIYIGELLENNTKIQMNVYYDANKTLSLIGEYIIDIFTLDFPNGYPGPFTQTIQEG